MQELYTSDFRAYLAEYVRTQQYPESLIQEAEAAATTEENISTLSAEELQRELLSGKNTTDGEEHKLENTQDLLEAKRQLLLSFPSEAKRIMFVRLSVSVWRFGRQPRSDSL